MKRNAVLVVAGVAAVLALTGCASGEAVPDPISESAYRSLVRGDFPVFAQSTDAQLTELGKSGCKSMTSTDDYGVAATLDAYETNPDLGLDESQARLLMNYQASAYCPQVLAQLEGK